MMELKDRLRLLSKSSCYPWHMPGHKRRFSAFSNPYELDITEITDFDDLHHPEGILKESMEHAASVYGAKKTWYLVNGSTCGIQAAITSCMGRKKQILLARNCHKSAYYAAQLSDLTVVSVYPEFEDAGFYGRVSPQQIQKKLEEYTEIGAVMIVSPTYEGLVSDVEAIARICHEKGCPLIVDEAHGAHFPFGAENGFPKSALMMGADLVIQSVHKTLPSLTQTALLHMGKDSLADEERLDFYLSVFQSSSPSYLFLSSIEHCILFMESREGKLRMERYANTVKSFRAQAEEKLKAIGLYGNPKDYDFGKLVLIPEWRNLPDGRITDGGYLSERLRDAYGMESEMHTERYVILMTSLMDEEAAFDRLLHALIDIDAEILTGNICDCPRTPLPTLSPEHVLGSGGAFLCEKRYLPLREARGLVCAAYIYIYPPGIPLLIPGEKIGEREIACMENYEEHGLCVHGLKDSLIPIAICGEL